MERLHIKFCISSFFGKTGSAGNTGLSFSYGSGQPEQKSYRAPSSLFFDLVCSLGHEVSTVPYSSLCIICLALLGMWFS